MQESIAVTGMVLSAMPIGDYDKRLVVLTRERGRITAFARGARRPTSTLLAAANPFVFGTFQIYEGRTAYNLIQASVKNYFTELAAEQPGVYYGFYFLEFADYFGREGNDEAQMLNLLYISMRALMNPRLSDELVRRIFELRAMVINGEYPETSVCAGCGRTEGFTGISVTKGGVVCSVCGKSSAGFAALSPAGLCAVQYAIAAPMEKLYTFTVTPPVLTELGAFMEQWLKRYVNHEFKSLEVLELFVKEEMPQ